RMKRCAIGDGFRSWPLEECAEVGMCPFMVPFDKLRTGSGSPRTEGVRAVHGSLRQAQDRLGLTTNGAVGRFKQRSCGTDMRKAPGVIDSKQLALCRWLARGNESRAIQIQLPR